MSVPPNGFPIAGRAGAMEGVLLYDEDCGYCQAWRDWALRRGSPIRFAPCQKEGPGHGLSDADCAAAAWFIGPHRRRGARAVCSVWRSLPGFRNAGWRMLGVVADLPVVRWVSALGYRIVARNRHRLRGPS